MESFVVAKLLNKIHTHTAQVAIIGLGYVGLPLAEAFAEAGFPVVGMDVDGGKGAARQSRRPQRRPLHLSLTSPVMEQWTASAKKGN